MKKILLSLLLTLVSTAALAVPLDIKMIVTRTPNVGGLPNYSFVAVPADPILQFGNEAVSYPYVINTPADPLNGIYANLTDAQADFVANVVPSLFTVVNTDFGTSYSSVGTISVFDKNLQTSLATGPTHTASGVTRTVNGTATQCSDPTKDNLVFISLNESQTLSLSGGQTGTLSLQTSPTLGGSYTTFSQVGNSNTGTLIVGLNTVAGNGTVLIGHIPAGYFYRIVSSGTGTNTVITGKEITI